MRRSLTQDLILGKQQNPDGRKTVLGERGSISGIICEENELTQQPPTPLYSRVGGSGMDLELDEELDRFDIENRGNQQVVPTVAKDIFKYLKGIEVRLIYYYYLGWELEFFWTLGVSVGGERGFCSTSHFFFG